MRRTLLWLAGIVAGVVIYVRWFRPWQLRWGATDEDVRREMPGDDVVDGVHFNATRAVTVNAPPEVIYPWIVQMGVTPRAGWYSYDLLDNLARPSAERIIPELQQVAVGDLIPMSPDGKGGVYVKAFSPNEWLVWGDDEGATTWVWGLYPQGDGRTRLVTRIRLRYQTNSVFNVLSALLVEFGDFPMMRQCLLGIKRRAERMAAG